MGKFAHFWRPDLGELSKEVFINAAKDVFGTVLLVAQTDPPYEVNHTKRTLQNMIAKKALLKFGYIRSLEKDPRVLAFMVGCPEMSHDCSQKNLKAFCMHFACSNRRYIRFILFVRSINQ